MNDGPSIAWVILSPSQISTLPLKHHGGMKRSTICADTLDDGNELPIAAFDLVGDLLIPVDQYMNFVAEPQLNALVQTRLKHSRWSAEEK